MYRITLSGVVRGAILSLILGLGLTATGCATAPPPSNGRVAVARVGQTKPHPHSLWVKGHYAYRSGRYVWVPGHWVRP